MQYVYQMQQYDVTIKLAADIQLLFYMLCRVEMDDPSFHERWRLVLMWKDSHAAWKE